MSIDRLPDMEENLEDLKEQLVGKVKSLNLAPQEEKIRIKQQIRELRKEIRAVPYTHLTLPTRVAV